ncbi:aminoglycoside phosphotransferase family protein [Clostridium brassicae]|uniref:Aminoglycoside phosphotransferase family protein n=1 Tax=Clostridium brassicae TaxID=2999072 RepID=A0ABT4DA10_9CLOT|nr:aminoglycoside phosphotransferase family protein [Clostridium brassicae]MCY6959147.1 aminoglycoside phosphotransferase family protein [Clostridium brassicae]
MESKIRNLVIDNVNQNPLKIEKMNLGFTNKVYSVKVGKDEIIVRTNNSPEVFKKLEHNLKKLKEIELPVPNILHIDLSKNNYDFAYVILEKIQGRDLRYEIEKMSISEMKDVAKEIVEYQRITMNLPQGEGFGKCNIGEKGIFNNWAEFIENEITQLKSIFEDVLGVSYFQNIVRSFTLLREYFNKIKPLCFLDEASLRNVIINKGKIEGLIDFDWICYGDPLYNVALIQIGTLLHLDNKCMYYVEEICKQWGINKHERIVIDFYSIIHIGHFLTFQLKMNNTEIINKLKYIAEKLNYKILAELLINQ